MNYLYTLFLFIQRNLLNFKFFYIKSIVEMSVVKAQPSPPVIQYSFSPALKQRVELHLKLLSLWLFRVSPRTVDIDYSNGFLFILTPVEINGNKNK